MGDRMVAHLAAPLCFGGSQDVAIVNRFHLRITLLPFPWVGGSNMRVTLRKEKKAEDIIGCFFG